jgi:hypothetical protein
MTQRIDTQSIGELAPPNRLMLTLGPLSMDPRVYRALIVKAVLARAPRVPLPYLVQ